MKKLNKPKPGILYPLFWHFAYERQNVFFKRLSSEPFPWSEDVILNTYKFRNVYRISDRTSQYLLKNVIHNGEMTPEEIIFRVLLFRTFNKVNIWERLQQELGEISWREFSLRNYVTVIEEAIGNGEKIYSGSCSLHPLVSARTHEKTHEVLLSLLCKCMDGLLPERTTECGSFSALWQNIHEYYKDKYLAYQLALDINYTPLVCFSEMDFTVAGPRAIKGVDLCFHDLGNYTYENIIMEIATEQEKEFKSFGLNFKNLYNRPMQLCDCEAVFGEMHRYFQIHSNGSSHFRKNSFKSSGIYTQTLQFPENW